MMNYIFEFYLRLFLGKARAKALSVLVIFTANDLDRIMGIKGVANLLSIDSEELYLRKIQSQEVRQQMRLAFQHIYRTENPDTVFYLKNIQGKAAAKAAMFEPSAGEAVYEVFEKAFGFLD